MRVLSRLRELRGELPLREMEARTRISRGSLSRYERGREFPPDKHVAVLEREYGAPVSGWFGPHVLVDLRSDDGQPIAEVAT